MQSAHTLTCLIGMAMLAGQAQVKNPVPQREISIASALKCRATKHLTLVRFSPDGSLVGALLSGGDHWHLIVVSRDGQTVRELAQESGVLPEYGFPTRRFIHWSPDGNYVALQGSPIRVVRLQDGGMCTIPRVGFYPVVGFVAGPRLVVLSGDPYSFLEFRGPDCELQETLPVPLDALRSASVPPDALTDALTSASTLPGGSGLVFSTATGIVITDPRGQHGKKIDLNVRSISKHLSKNARLDLRRGWFTENGAVFCAGLEDDMGNFEPHCIELGTGQEAGKPPPNRVWSLPRDSAEQGTRGLWKYPSSSVFTFVPDLLFRGSGAPVWLVWDYRAAAKILQLGPFRWSNWTDFPVALAPRGDAVAVVKNDVVMFWELPRETR